jgi:hypothetical protein
VDEKKHHPPATLNYRIFRILSGITKQLLIIAEIIAETTLIVI